MSHGPTLPRKIQDAKDETVFAYWDKKLSHKLATARLKELGFEEWEINLYLDDDQTGPE